VLKERTGASCSCFKVSATYVDVAYRAEPFLRSGGSGGLWSLIFSFSFKGGFGYFDAGVRFLQSGGFVRTGLECGFCVRNEGS
jgi:hypothetical protein